MSLKQQKCKMCGQSDKFDYHVPDNIWNDIVPRELRKKVVCLSCFDELAKEKGVIYAGFLHELHFAGSQASLVFRLVAYGDSQSIDMYQYSS